MNALLSVLLSLIMLCSLSGDVTAARSGAIENINLRVGGSEYALDCVLNYTYAVSPDSLTFNSSVYTPHGEIMPFAFKIDNTGTDFLINDRDRYYTVSAIDPATDDAIRVSRVCAAITPVLNCVTDFKNADRSADIFSAYLDAYIGASAASVKRTDVTVGDTVIPARTVVLSISPLTMMSAADILLHSNDPVIAAAFEGALNAISIADDAEYSSFIELVPDTAGEGIPVTFTLGSSEDLSVGRQEWSSAFTWQNSDISITACMDTCSETVTYKMDLEITASDHSIVSSSVINVTVPASETDPCAISGNSALTFTNFFDDSDAEEIDLADITRSETALRLSLDASVLGDIVNMKADGKYTVKDSAPDGGDERVLADSDLHLTIESFEEDEKIHSALTVSASNIQGVGDFEFSCTNTLSDSDLIDPFIGAEIMLDPTDAAYSFSSLRLVGDAAGYVNDALKTLAEFLPENFGAQPLTAVFSAFSPDYDEDDPDPEIGSEDDEDEDDSDDDDDIEAANAASLQEAEKIYTGKIPSFTAPHGYVMGDIYAEKDMLSVDFYTDNGDGYIGVYLSVDDEPGTALVSYYHNDDDTVYGAEILADGIPVTVYFSDTTVDQAEAILIEMGLI